MISNSAPAAFREMAAAGHHASAVHRSPKTQTKRDVRRLVGVGLTLTRFPLLALAIALVVQGRTNAILAAVIGAIVLADIFDGIVYESAHSVTAEDVRRRHVLDAISDRIAVHSLFVSAWLAGSLDLALYLPVLLREVVLAGTVSVPFLTRRLALSANLPSKIGTVLAAIILLVGLNGGGPNLALVATFVLFSGIGIVEYVRQGSR